MQTSVASFPESNCICFKTGDETYSDLRNVQLGEILCWHQDKNEKEKKNQTLKLGKSDKQADKHFHNFGGKRAFGGNRSNSTNKKPNQTSANQDIICVFLFNSLLFQVAESVSLRSDTEVLQQCIIVRSVLLKGWILGVLTQRARRSRLGSDRNVLLHSRQTAEPSSCSKARCAAFFFYARVLTCVNHPLFQVGEPN